MNTETLLTKNCNVFFSFLLKILIEGTRWNSFDVGYTINGVEQNKNQRTNGHVNARLTTGPGISNINHFCQI